MTTCCRHCLGTSRKAHGKDRSGWADPPPFSQSFLMLAPDLCRQHLSFVRHSLSFATHSSVLLGTKRSPNIGITPSDFAGTNKQKRYLAQRCDTSCLRYFSSPTQ